MNFVLWEKKCMAAFSAGHLNFKPEMQGSAAIATEDRKDLLAVDALPAGAGRLQNRLKKSIISRPNKTTPYLGYELAQNVESRSTEGDIAAGSGANTGSV